MSRQLKAERRLYPRIEHSLPVKIAANGYDFATSTENISCVGAYCRISKYIPPFTRIAVKLSLPMRSADKVDNRDVECRGVIVRTEDNKDGGFNIAIFFNNMKNTQRQAISKYINQLFP